MPELNNLFYEIALILAISGIAGAIALKLRQPLLIAFIAVGILVGPSGVGWVMSSDQVDLFAEMGITLLLFVVGLKLDPHEIRAVGPVAIAVGAGQMVLTATIGYGIGIAMGLPAMDAFYIAVGLTFSSTIIIVKLLSDKKEIDALHGRIALGVLILQDIAVVLVMIVLSAFGGEEATSLGVEVVMVALKGVGFLTLVAALTRFVLPPLLHELARSQELLVLSAIAWAIALAAGADILGFSTEMGAFLAGVAIASTSYRVPISARLVTLRDFLLLFFFINLGVHIDLGSLGQQIAPALIFAAFVIIGKILMVLALMGVMGYRKYTSTLTGLSLSQISEFSLILAALGVELGHIGDDTLGLITLVGLITMGLSTYLILYSHLIYPHLAPWLDFFERAIAPQAAPNGNSSEVEMPPIDVIIFGLGRYGGRLMQELRRNGFEVFGIDFDPEVVEFWHKQGVWTLYGDAEDPELTSLLPLNQAQWVISTLPNYTVGITLVHTLEHHRYQGQIALTSHSVQDEEILLEAGADMVLLPFRDAAKQAARMLVNLSLEQP